MKPYQEVAVAFAAALVERDFARARALLVPALREQLTEGDLRDQLTSIYRCYARSAPTHSRFVTEGTVETWPGKQADDLGWAYVSIEGDDFAEAVYVLVSDVDGVPMIRKIEWGRP